MSNIELLRHELDAFIAERGGNMTSDEVVKKALEIENKIFERTQET